MSEVRNLHCFREGDVPLNPTREEKKTLIREQGSDPETTKGKDRVVEAHNLHDLREGTFVGPWI